MRSDIENRRSWGKSTRFKYSNVFLNKIAADGTMRVSS